MHFLYSVRSAALRAFLAAFKPAMTEAAASQTLAPAATPPSERSLKYLAPTPSRQLSYASDQDDSTGFDTTTICLQGPVPFEMDYLSDDDDYYADAWDRYDEYEEDRFRHHNRKLQHNRIRSSRRWTLDSQGEYKSASRRSHVKFTTRRCRNRALVRSLPNRLERIVPTIYWEKRLGWVPNVTSTSPVAAAAVSTQQSHAAVLRSQPRAVQANVLSDPTCQRQRLLAELQYRDITPEDYVLLLELDEQIQAKYVRQRLALIDAMPTWCSACRTVSKRVFAQLERVAGQHCDSDTCSICMDLFQVSESKLAQCPAAS
eukprot:TRINITY_DN12478_c4_g7_i1.p1 TRINITY_DN12478_c4_g7~~TRINITY_DN12478_c4_g7_i1.p1  ORF type:complete len:316 (+),score=45.90 TRINITY_DN12478_c4_g7_i1:366-1313(+)